jgi:hypothetical protein
VLALVLVLVLVRCEVALAELAEQAAEMPIR